MTKDSTLSFLQSHRSSAAPVRAPLPAQPIEPGSVFTAATYGEVSDYTKKGGVIASEIMLPPHAPEIYLDRATLWNAVENCEKHPKAQLAYSFDIAMQNELTLEENMGAGEEVRTGAVCDKRHDCRPCFSQPGERGRRHP